MTDNQKYFSQLIQQFYVNATKNHSKKIILQKKYQNFLKNSSKSSNKSPQPINSPKIYSKKMTIKDLNFLQSPLVSSKQSSSSNLESKCPHNHQLKVLYQSRSFSKSIIFAYFNLLIDLGESQTLTNLKEEFFNKFEDVLKNSEFERMSFYWGKIIQLSKSRQENWGTTFLECFKFFSSQYIDQMFLIMTNMDPKNLSIQVITKEKIMNISQLLDVNVNYFILSKDSIIFQIMQNQQHNKSINLVFIKQKEKYIVNKDPLKNTPQQKAIQQLTFTLGSSITKILQKYESEDIFSSFENSQDIIQRQSQSNPTKNSFNFKSQNYISKLKAGFIN